MCVHVPNGPILHIPGPSISVHHVPVTLCHLSVMSLLVVAMPLISLPFICLYNAMTLCRSIMSLSFVSWSLPFISWSPMTLSSISARHVPVPYGSLFFSAHVPCLCPLSSCPWLTQRSGLAAWLSHASLLLLSKQATDGRLDAFLFAGLVEGILTAVRAAAVRRETAGTRDKETAREREILF